MDYPNTYGFTKGLSEDLVHQYREKFPVAVARPTISAYEFDLN